MCNVVSLFSARACLEGVVCSGEYSEDSDELAIALELAEAELRKSSMLLLPRPKDEVEEERELVFRVMLDM